MKNIFTPGRFPDETQEDYKTRRAFANDEAKAIREPAKTTEHIQHFNKTKRREQKFPSGQNPKAVEVRIHKRHVPTTPFVSKVGKPKRAWCPEKPTA